MKIIYKDVFEGLNDIENNSVRCCITSPPYYQCRNYNRKNQIGLEENVKEYIDKLCNVFDKVYKKLTNDGNLFINMGDKYKDKDLLLIPADFAQEMRARGWILRNDIIWYKPNFQPSPVKDRLANTYEHIFHFVKQKRGYYYDLDSVRLPNKCNDLDSERTYKRFKSRIVNSDLNGTEKKMALEDLDKLYYENKINKDARLKLRNQSKPLYGSDTSLSGRARELQEKGYYFHCNNPKGKNPGDLLSVNIKSHKGAHEAVFPEELIRPLIKVGSSKDDIVLDCFAGTGTTCRVASELGRIGIGIELNEDYKIQ